MKRNFLFILVAIIGVIGLALGQVLHGNTKASGIPVKDGAGAHAAVASRETRAATSVQEPQLSRLTGISIRTAGSGKGTTIKVATSRPTDYRVIHLDNPDRLVLDLERAQNSTDRWRYSSVSPLLARVRVGRFSPEFGGIIRVVADLQGDPAYCVDRQPTGFRIELTPKDGGIQGEMPHPVAAAARPLTPVPDENPAALRQIAETTPAASVHRLKKPPEAHSANTIALRHDPLLSAAPQTPASAIDPAVPVAKPRPQKQEFPEALQAAKAARVVSKTGNEAASQVEVPVRQNVEFQNGIRYTGKRISLNLKGVDLKDFFRLIHEVSGLNIIVDPDVSGTVTVVLDDVPWDQALALVLDNNGLGDRLEGNVLRIAKMTTLTEEQMEQQKLSLAREDSAPLATIFRQLNYAKAATLAALLKTWVGGGALSQRGSVLVDERTNTLIISDIASHIPRIESVISKLDKKAEQVSIQARIIRATSDFARNLSTALSFAQRNGSGSVVLGGASGNPVSGEPLTPPSVTTSPATGFGVFVLSNLGRNYAINAAIAAAESHDQAKTISQPSIVTQNNVEGTVIQGTQIPIQTTINNTISVQYVQASLQLKVTPQVTQDGNVFLSIEIQNSSPGPALTLAGPTINTQSATTQVLVPNGGTVVFGGVTVHTKSNSSTGIPLLESIPVLGHLFKSTTEQRNDQELLFFVTPKILT
jgi:type IV pilus assembly protein PilQ